VKDFLENQKRLEADILNRIIASEKRWAFGAGIDLKSILTSTLILPHWFPVLLFATFAAIPWLVPRRFSLRTLLIATTLVAAVLGLAVWLR
jgi:hypothetical protein